MSEETRRDAMRRLGGNMKPDPTKPRLIGYAPLKSGLVALHVLIPEKRYWWGQADPPRALLAIGAGAHWADGRINPEATGYTYSSLQDLPSDLCAILAEMWLHRKSAPRIKDL